MNESGKSKQRRAPRNLNESDSRLWKTAQELDCSTTDVFRLGLLRIRIYDAIVKLMEKGSGGIFCSASIACSKRTGKYCIVSGKNDRALRMVSRGDGGIPGKTARGRKHFFILGYIGDGDWKCRMAEGKRNEFVMHVYHEHFTVAVAKKIYEMFGVEVGTWAK